MGSQYVRPNRTTGKCRILPVWISVSDSKSSSSVPKPPGKTTNPSVAFTNIVLRVEMVERVRDVQVRVGRLFVRELDVEADREPSGPLRPAVRRLHQPRAAAGHDRESLP